MVSRLGYARKKDRWVPQKHSQDHVLEVLQEVEAICYLDGTRCRPSDGIGVLSAAITAYHFYAGVLDEPRSGRSRAPIGQYVRQPVALQVNQYSSPAAPTPEGEVVYAQDSWRRRLYEVE